jgi:aminoglycoside phosphotransferase (APT) family kinase protein
VRANWRRTGGAGDLDRAGVARLVQAGLPAARVTGHHKALGGQSNTNIVVELAGPPARVVLRLYQRDPRQPRKEKALDELLAKRGAPSARILHVADDNPVNGLPYAIFEWIDGHRLETVMLDMRRDHFAELAGPIGVALAAIHGIAFAHTGFFGDDLGVAEAVDLGGAGLVAHLRRRLHAGPGGARLGQKLTAQLLHFAEQEGSQLEDWLGRPCLTHADFNPSNILVRRTNSGAWTVAAVIDWEFAFAGSPAFDFGNLLRPPLGDAPGFADAVAKSYAAAGGRLPADWLRIARIADLYAWADFLARPDPSHAVVAEARRRIEAVIAAG